MASIPHTVDYRAERTISARTCTVRTIVSLICALQTQRSSSVLDWVSCILCLGFSMCIVLGLTWGGAVKPWKSVSVLFPLCLAGVLLVFFFFWEAKMGRRALVPLHLFKRWTHAGACLERVSHNVSFSESGY